MSFTSKNLHKSSRGGLNVLKWATLFFLGMSCVLFLTRAYLIIQPSAANTQTVFEKLILTLGGDPTAPTGVVLNGASGDAYFAGKVGVGIENPNHTLEIVGDVKINDRIYSDNDNTYIDFGQAWPLHKFEVGLSGDTFLNIFRYPSSSVFIIDPNDLWMKVWIGTSSPTEKLHINGNVVVDSISQTNKLLLWLWYSQISNPSEIYSDTDLYIKWPIRNNVTGRSVYIQWWSTGTSYGKVILADEWGNVVVGWPTPSGIGEGKFNIYNWNLLMASDNAPTWLWALVFNNDIGYNSIQWVYAELPTWGVNWIIWPNKDLPGWTWWLAIATDNATPINFYTNGAKRMTITSAGNVGIGTTGPTEKLEVSGRGKFWTNLQTYSDTYNGIIQSDENLKFNTNGANVRMVIDSSWDVWLNVADPTAKLDVLGNVKILSSMTWSEYTSWTVWYFPQWVQTWLLNTWRNGDSIWYVTCFNVQDVPATGLTILRGMTWWNINVMDIIWIWPDITIISHAYFMLPLVVNSTLTYHLKAWETFAVMTTACKDWLNVFKQEYGKQINYSAWWWGWLPSVLTDIIHVTAEGEAQVTR